MPLGAIFPWRVDWVGAQPFARSAEGGAVWAGGVAGVGGACAYDMPDAANNTEVRKSVCLICMPGKRPALAEVPERIQDFR
jgi:hypothetical protein